MHEEPDSFKSKLNMCYLLKEYSPEDWAELPVTKFADRQPSSRAVRPESLVELSANKTFLWGN